MSNVNKRLSVRITHFDEKNVGKFNEENEHKGWGIVIGGVSSVISEGALGQEGMGKKCTLKEKQD